MPKFDVIRKWGGVLFTIGLLAGCGEDSYSISPNSKHPVVKSVQDLGDCGEEQQGDSVYVSLEDVYLVCQDGFWIAFESFEDPDNPQNKGKKSSSSSAGSAGSSSTKKASSSSSSDSEPTSGTSTSSSSITALNIYVAADDTLPSIKHLRECNSSHEGRYVFIASLNGYMKCTGEKWTEFTPSEDDSPYVPLTLDSISKDGKSNLNNYFDFPDSLLLFSSSSRSNYELSIKDAEEVLGKCGSNNDGAFVTDTARLIGASQDNLYYCKKGIWSGVTTVFADTLGFGPGTPDSFKEANVSEPTEDMSEYCDESLKNAGKRLFVYDNGWRMADPTEVCFKKSCSKRNEGEIIDFKGYPFICHAKEKWEYMTIYERPRQNYFNENIEYGTMVDERDGQEYKTLEAGGYMWMAENLNYAGDDSKMGKCYNDKPKNCEITGRFYNWHDALQLAYSPTSTPTPKDTLKHQGLCPDGWRIPTLSEWDKSFRNASVKTMAKDIWGFVSDSRSITNRDDYNQYGLTLLPSGVYRSNDWVHQEAYFCTASRRSFGSDVYYIVAEAYTDQQYSEQTQHALGAGLYCHLRCIKKIQNVGGN